MTNQFPITPPPKLVGDWLTEAADLHLLTPTNLDYLATQAAQWGADQELEACKQYMHDQDWFMSPTLRMTELHNARRPKSPSLKEQALKELRQLPIDPELGVCASALDTIRRALEALDA